VLSIIGTTDTLTLSQYFWNDGDNNFQMEGIRFSDGSGTAWVLDEIKSMVLEGDDEAQRITGFGADETINAEGGNDNVSGAGGEDLLYGGSGNDTLRGNQGYDRLFSGSGNDNLYGDDGNDVLSGGAGNDNLTGGKGDDVYEFGRGSGRDSINTNDTSADNFDVAELAADIAESDATVSRSGNNLVMSINDTGDRLTLSQYFWNDGENNFQMEEIRFNDGSGTVWRLDDVKALALEGKDTAQTLTGYATDDTIDVAGGNDRLYGGDCNDTLYGEADNDNLSGGKGHDYLSADYMEGGEGDDTYVAGDGDTILDTDGFGRVLFGNTVLSGGVSTAS
jgi:Ca2+-binding RTX toxin-like protein